MTQVTEVMLDNQCVLDNDEILDTLFPPSSWEQLRMNGIEFLRE